MTAKCLETGVKQTLEKLRMLHISQIMDNIVLNCYVMNSPLSQTCREFACFFLQAC